VPPRADVSRPRSPPRPLPPGSASTFERRHGPGGGGGE
jgi:hypothetical protein